MNRKKKPRKKALPANYGDATPEDVARALHRYRPKRRSVTPEKVEQEPARVNSRA